MKKLIMRLLCIVFILLMPAQTNAATAAPSIHNRTLTLDIETTFQTMEGFGFFGARTVWWDEAPFSPFRNLPIYYGGEPVLDLEWIDFILLDLGITMWRNEIYPFLPVYSRSATNTQDSDWPQQRVFVKALNDRAVELGIDLRIILTVWSPPGEWKYNQHTRALAGSQNPPPPPAGMEMHEWNRLMPEHYVDFAYWLVSALEMYQEIGVDVYAISPQNEPFFNQSFNSSAYSAREFVEMLNVVAPIINKYFPDVCIFGAEAMLGHEHSSEIYGWSNSNMHFHRRILELASPEAMRNFVFAHHGYYDGVYARALESHPVLWAAERYMLGNHGANSSPSHRLWMTETSGYSNEWLEANPDRPGSLALGMAIQSALVYGDVSAWVWWQGSSTYRSPYGGYYELMRPGLNQNKIAVSRHFYRYVRPGAVRIGAELNEASRYLMVSAFVHHELDNTVIVIVNNGVDYYNLDIEGIANGTNFQSFTTTGSPDYMMPGSVMGNITVPPHSIITLVNGNYIEHASPAYPAVTPAEMAQRDVYLTINKLESINARGTTFVTTDRLAHDESNSLIIVNALLNRWAFFTDWEIVEESVVFSPDSLTSDAYLKFQVRVSQGDYYDITSVLTLHIENLVPVFVDDAAYVPYDDEDDAEPEEPDEPCALVTPEPLIEDNENSVLLWVMVAVLICVVGAAIIIIFCIKRKKG